MVLVAVVLVVVSGSPARIPPPGIPEPPKAETGPRPVEAANAGSVTPAFVFGELKGSLAHYPFPSPPNPFLSGLGAPLAQTRVVAGAGLDVSGHRLLIGVSILGSAVFEPANLRYFVGALTPSLTVRPTTAGVINLGRFAIRPRFALPVTPTLGQRRFALVGVEPGVHARVQLSRALVGVEADALINIPSASTPVCLVDEPSCSTNFFTRWSVSASLIAEWFFNDHWSTGIRARLERSEGEIISFQLPRLVSLERVEALATWSPVRFFGVTASAAATFTQAQGPTDGSLSSFGREWSLGLSFWVRTDARLKRHWLDL
ncbi:MAG: hypothetical protein JNM17_09175 [Archangium sp.]|nr:hypothetical protein [Archangium sp.]